MRRAPLAAVALGLVLGAGALCASAFAPASPVLHEAQAKTSIASSKVTFSYAKERYYTGKAIKPKVKAYCKGKRIESRYLKVSYSKNRNAGKARIEVSGTGKYRGKKTLKFRIYYNMADAKVTTPRRNYRRTGKAIKPKPTVKFDGAVVPEDSYTVSYKNNVEGDRAKVVVTGKGDYKGTKTRSFKIVGEGGLVVDVSEHNGSIKWKKVAKEVDLAILRAHVTYTVSSHAHRKAGDGKMRQDTRYDEYATGCEENDVPYGAYAYLVFQGKTKAKVKADAKDQAKKFYASAFSNGHRPLFLALDLEDSLMDDEGHKVAYGAQAAAEKLRELAAADGIEDLKVGLYCGGQCYDTFGFTTFDGRYIAKNDLDFTWYPAYSKDTGYLPAISYKLRHPDAWDMWQYSSKGRVSGISGYADVSTIRADGPHARALAWYQKR